MFSELRWNNQAQNVRRAMKPVVCVSHATLGFARPLSIESARSERKVERSAGQHRAPPPASQDQPFSHPRRPREFRGRRQGRRSQPSGAALAKTPTSLRYLCTMNSRKRAFTENTDVISRLPLPVTEHGRSGKTESTSSTLSRK